MPARKIRYAVVGLGYISQIAMLPAFKGAARNSELAALVSGTPRKLKALGGRYGIESLWSYDRYEDLLASGTIDAVYIGLPNTLHKAYTVAAAKAGVHVLCDKPLATSVADCAAMIAAAERGKVGLMTAYRLHFEAGALAAQAVVDKGEIGELRYFSSEFSMQVKPGNIRLDRKLGGGPVFDLGIYCINAARHLFGAEPIEVSAQAASARDRRFASVEEMANVSLRFPGDRLANFICSFGAADAANLQLWGTKGNLRFDAVYDMFPEKELTVERVRRGKPVRQTRTFAKHDPFAPLLLHFSDTILSGRRLYADGAEGMADIRVIEAIYRSIAKGRPVALPPVKGARRPALPPRPITVPPHPEADLIMAAGPS